MTSRRDQKTISDLNVLLDLALDEFERLAKLGAEPYYGNSIGNDIAIKAMAAIRAGRKMIEVE